MGFETDNTNDFTNESLPYQKKSLKELVLFEPNKRIQMPFSNDAEMAVLGSMMLEQAAISRTTELVQKESFFREQHQKLFEVISSMAERGLSVDFITLIDELRRRKLLEFVGGSHYIVQLQSSVPTAANVEQYARIVQEYYLRRKLIITSQAIIKSAYDDSNDALLEVDKAESMIFEIAEQRIKRSFLSMKSLATIAISQILEIRNKGTEGLSGVPSGFTKLDNILGGFQRSDLIILAARPSMGKTALALSIARNMAVVFKKPIGFFSVEMDSRQLVTRLLSAEARINAHFIRTGKISDSDVQKIIKQMQTLSMSPMYIDDSPALTIMELRAKCRRMKAEHQIEAIFIDYLQLLHEPRAESREREVSTISRALKQIAKELDIAVIALSQLNRNVESRGDKIPMLSDLRESGSIEQDADVVMFVHRPEYYKITTYEDGTPTEGTAQLIVAKQRNGPVGDVRVAYLKDYARFENLTTDYKDIPDFDSFSQDSDPGF